MSTRVDFPERAEPLKVGIYIVVACLIFVSIVSDRQNEAIMSETSPIPPKAVVNPPLRRRIVPVIRSDGLASAAASERPRREQRSATMTSPEIKRLIGALKKSGVEIGAVRFMPDGGLKVFTTAMAAEADGSAFDEWKDRL